VDEESGSDQNRNYSDPPQAANDLSHNVVAGFLRHDVEEEIEKDRQAEAGEAGNDAALDLIDPSLFRRSTHLLLYFLSEDNISRPALAPIRRLLNGTRRHPLARAVQIRAALTAEFEIIADSNTTSWTEHVRSSCGNLCSNEFIRY